MQTSSAIPIFPVLCTIMLLLSCLPPNTPYLFRSAVPKTGPCIPPEALPVLSRRYHPRSIPTRISQDNKYDTVGSFDNSFCDPPEFFPVLFCKLSKNCSSLWAYAADYSCLSVCVACVPVELHSIFFSEHSSSLSPQKLSSAWEDQARKYSMSLSNPIFRLFYHKHFVLITSCPET